MNMNLNRTSRAGAFVLIACLVLLNQISPAMAWRGSERHETVPTGAAGQEFDLASQTASMAAGHELFAGASTANINVGGTVRTVQAGDMLTAAEYVALRQVLSQGTQSLLLDAQGAAAGGTFSLNTIGSRHLASLVVPEGVVAVSQGLYNNMNISGALSARGQIFGDVNRALTLRAGSVDVGVGGSITTATARPINLNIYSLSNISNAGSITASGVLNLNAAGAIVNALPEGASGATPVMSGAMGTNLFAGSGQVTNAGLISSANGNVNIRALPNADLVVNNVGGQISALQGAIALRDASYSLKQFTGVDGGRLSANALNLNAGEGLVKVLADQIDGVVNLHAGMASINSNGGTLMAGDWTVTGDPTIANSGGDVVLLGNLAFNGEDLAILASGNVRTITSGSLVTISTCKDCTNSGDVFIVAGFDFTPATAGQVTNTTTTYTLGSASASGGDVSLPNFSIKTSGAKNDAGDVTVVAHSGDLSSGFIELKAIDASAKSGIAGDVLLIGQLGVVTGQGITTTGLTGGNVDVLGEEPLIDGGTITFLNGTKGGVGEFIGSGIPSPGVNGSFVTIGGAINTFASRASGGEVMLSADSSVYVLEGIATFGGPSVTGVGGAVLISSFESAVVVNGPIRSRGGDTVTSAVAPSGGLVSIFGASGITVSGSITSRGGSNLGTGEGGDGGGILLATQVNSLGTSPRLVNTGSIVISGVLDSRGGNTSGSLGGDGGTISTASGTLQVFGTSGGGGASINASAGTGGGGSGDDAFIDIATFGVQSVPTNFDLVSMDTTEFAIPGGLFNVGNANVNGTRGTIVSGASVASAANAANVIDPGFEVGAVDINVTNSSFIIIEGVDPVLVSAQAAPGVRTMVTPGEALALFQVSRDSSASAQQIGLNSDGQVRDAAPFAPFEGSNITIPSTEITNAFTSFNLSTVEDNIVTVYITGTQCALLMPSNVQTFINGTLIFTTTGANNTISFGKSPLFVGETGSILATDDSSLGLFGDGGAAPWVNNGTLEAGQITFNTRKALTLEMGTTGVLSNDTAGGITQFFPGGNLVVEGGGFTNTALNASVPNTASIRIVSFGLSGGELGNFSAGKEVNLEIDGDAVFTNESSVSGRSISVTSTGLVQLGTSAGLGVTMTTTNGSIVITSSGAFTELSSESLLQAGGTNSSLVISAGDTITIGSGTSLLAPGKSASILLQEIAGDFFLEGNNTVAAGQDVTLVVGAGGGDLVIYSLAGDGNVFTAGRDLVIINEAGTATLNSGGLSTGTFSSSKGVVLIGGIAGTAVGDMSEIFADSGLEIAALAGGITIGVDTVLSNNKNDLIVGALEGGITIGEGSEFTSGVLKPTAPSVGVLKQSDIRFPGSMALITSDGDIFIESSPGSPTRLISNGGDIFGYNDTGDIEAGENTIMQANGGNLIITANNSGKIRMISGNEIVTRAVGTKSRFTGGGVEIGSGVEIPSIAEELANRPATFTVDPPGLPTGATIFQGASRGLVKTVLSGGGTVTLNYTGTNSQLDIYGGVTLFQALGADNSVQMNDASIRVDAPVAYEGPYQGFQVLDGCVVDTGDVCLIELDSTLD